MTWRHDVTVSRGWVKSKSLDSILWMGPGASDVSLKWNNCFKTNCFVFFEIFQDLKKKKKKKLFFLKFKNLFFMLKFEKLEILITIY